MPKNNSKSRKQERRISAHKRRTRELGFWLSKTNNGDVIRSGKVCSPDLKVRLCESDLASLVLKLNPVHQMTPINNMSIEEYLDADLEFTKGLLTN